MTTETYHYKLNRESRIVTRAPKQRLINIHLVCVDGHQSINYNAHIKARTNLSKNAFQLYDFLELLPNGLIWSMSSKVLYEETALKEDTYSKAFRELLDKGYLFAAPIQTDDGVVKYDTYHFYEDCDMNPKKQYEVSPANQEKKEPSSFTRTCQEYKPMSEARPLPQIRKFEPWKK